MVATLDFVVVVEPGGRTKCSPGWEACSWRFTKIDVGTCANKRSRADFTRFLDSAKQIGSYLQAEQNMIRWSARFQAKAINASAPAWSLGDARIGNDIMTHVYGRLSGLSRDPGWSIGQRDLTMS